MEALIRVDGQTTVKVEGDTHAELFEEIATAKEIYEHSQCGHCKSVNFKYVVRQDEEDNKYYELHCIDSHCRARLPFGLAKKGGVLYPKRRFASLSPKEQEKRKDEKDYADKHGGFLPNNGWYKYKPEGKPNDKAK